MDGGSEELIGNRGEGLRDVREAVRKGGERGVLRSEFHVRS